MPVLVCFTHKRRRDLRDCSDGDLIQDRRSLTRLHQPWSQPEMN